MRKLFSTLILTLLVATLAPGQPLIKKALLAAPQQYATLLNGTSQYWSKASPNNLNLNGAEMLSNPTFDTNTNDWFGQSGITISHETTIKRTGAGSLKMTSDGTASGSIVSGLSVDATSNKFTGEIWFYSPAASTGRNVILRLTKQDQTNFSPSITTATITLIADTWTKLVVNGKTDGTQTSIRMRVYFVNPSAGDILYVDDASITQAYDAMILLVVSGLTPSTTSQTPFAVKDATVDAAASSYYAAGIRNTNGFSRTFMSDGVTTIDGTSSSLPANDDKYHLLITTCDRAGNATRYVDGALTAGGTTAISTLGKLSGMLTVLTRGSVSNQFWSGKIGSIQIVRFNSLPSDIAQTIARTNSTWKRSGLPKAYAGGTVVAHYNWRAQGTDISGNGNHLTPVASPPIIKIQP